MSSLQRRNPSEMESQYNAATDCPVPYISCVCKGVPLPLVVDGDEAGVRMRCTNIKCPMVKLLIHEKCFEQLEETLLKILSNRGSARGWTDAQLRSNLWERKGLTLVIKDIRCRCGLGQMSRDVDFYKKHELEQAKDSQQQADAKQRKKKNQKKKLPSLNFNGNAPVAAELLQNDYVGVGRRASYGHSTSLSSSTLFYGQLHAVSDSESDNVYELRRNIIPTPTKSKIIVEKPKPLSAEHPSTKPKCTGSHAPKPLLRQRKEQRKAPKEPEVHLKSSASGKEKQKQGIPKKDEMMPKQLQGPQPQKVASQKEGKKDEQADTGEEEDVTHSLTPAPVDYFLASYCWPKHIYRVYCYRIQLDALSPPKWDELWKLCFDDDEKFMLFLTLCHIHWALYTG